MTQKLSAIELQEGHANDVDAVTHNDTGLLSVQVVRAARETWAELGRTSQADRNIAATGLVWVLLRVTDKKTQHGTVNLLKLSVPSNSTPTRSSRSRKSGLPSGFKPRSSRTSALCYASTDSSSSEASTRTSTRASKAAPGHFTRSPSSALRTLNPKPTAQAPASAVARPASHRRSGRRATNRRPLACARPTA